jgi:ABC-2 type transport system permease protein
MSGLWRHELRLFLRQRIALPALLLMALLSAASVWAGLAEVARQTDAIARIQPQQAEDLAAVAGHALRDADAGNVAYYAFHATWDPPAPLAFAALGQRDVAPYLLRVRALALESQIHESENYNAELALPGRFDWAFVLTFLAPLVLIVLLHDLVSGEREAGRLRVLDALARDRMMLWLRRIILRVGLLATALLLPFAVGAVIAGASANLPAVAGLTLLYLAFWTAVSLLVGRIGLGSVANAASLAAAWLVLTLVLPALALLAINGTIPARQGVELTLAQREAVHGGWDLPKDTTLAAFGRLYPEWRDTPPVEGGFDWKWYYAFQHLGDVRVADQTRAYRAALEARDDWTRRLALALPPLGTQVALHRLAETDLAAQLAYQDRIRAYHARLRAYFYPFLFEKRPFTAADFAAMPRWTDAGGKDPARLDDSADR